jgi:hypothetical protein
MHASNVHISCEIILSTGSKIHAEKMKTKWNFNRAITVIMKYKNTDNISGVNNFYINASIRRINAMKNSEKYID